MDRRRPPITEILHTHLAQQLEGKSGLRRRRVETAAAHLERYLETEGPAQLTDHDRTVLEMERQFDSDRAFLHTMNADPLVLALPDFLCDPWLLPDRIDRAAQVRYASALSDLITRCRLVNGREFLLPLTRLHVALLTARRDVDRERIAASTRRR
ncbi:hypothetical protein L2X99_02275 [Microbacterium sp. KUDC0406]|uniref:hypothetical protein n=1 Tax=Microbacterium sp. KUDC0406 TaxID=2909588 RepID=UPI001F1E2322|nr:hypothetical protein [Microbacterium sp. KUDC0406]UJP10533.1 hypothetical protein L2X99_02275 [Microbacterium sp. KUDC0406]